MIFIKVKLPLSFNILINFLAETLATEFLIEKCLLCILDFFGVSYICLKLKDSLVLERWLMALLCFANWVIISGKYIISSLFRVVWRT